MLICEVVQLIQHTDEDDKHLQQRMRSLYATHSEWSNSGVWPLVPIARFGAITIVTNHWPPGLRPVFFFLDGKTPIGYAILQKGGRDAHYDEDHRFAVKLIWFEAAYRGQGLARAFYDFLPQNGIPMKPDTKQTVGGTGIWKNRTPAPAVRESMQPVNIATDLIRRFGGRRIRFRDLPETVRRAIVTRASEHLHMGQKPRINPNKFFGYVEIPMEALKQSVLQGVQAEGGSFKDFDEYHRWYVGQRDVPDHTEIWPIELETEIPDEMGLIHDGSHRFHSYVRSGVQVVPAIYQI